MKTLLYEIRAVALLAGYFITVWAVMLLIGFLLYRWLIPQQPPVVVTLTSTPPAPRKTVTAPPPTKQPLLPPLPSAERLDTRFPDLPQVR